METQQTLVETIKALDVMQILVDLVTEQTGSIGRTANMGGSGNSLNSGNIGRDANLSGSGNSANTGRIGRDANMVGGGNSLNSKSVGNDLTIGGHGNQANIGRRRRFRKRRF